jgi:hypothetical protein
MTESREGSGYERRGGLSGDGNSDRLKYGGLTRFGNPLVFDIRLEVVEGSELGVNGHRGALEGRKQRLRLFIHDGEGIDRGRGGGGDGGDVAGFLPWLFMMDGDQFKVNKSMNADR